MLRGIDVSHWNRNVDYNQDFIIIKASEGVGYKDPMLDTHYNNFVGNTSGKPDPNKLYGFYHYARPETGNEPEAEADSFLNYVGHHAGNCLYCLDWEGKALNYNINWALRWLRRVFEKTGVRPLIYCSASVTTKLKPILEEDYGLWVAHYGVTKPKVSVYPFYAIWQYTSSPIDKDLFNGTAETFKKYCRKVQ